MSTRQSCHPVLSRLLHNRPRHLASLSSESCFSSSRPCPLSPAESGEGQFPPRAGAHEDSSPRPHTNTRLALPSWYGAPPPSARAAQDKRLASPLGAPTREPSVLSGYLPFFRLFVSTRGYLGAPVVSSFHQRNWVSVFGFLVVLR